MKFIDVTLRDGGHCVDFNWPIGVASKYVQTALESNFFSFVELGYWNQVGKFDGQFYRVDLELLSQLPRDALNRLAVMADFHYLNTSVDDFPSAHETSVGLLRLTSRKEDVAEALAFLTEVRHKRQLATSLNIFNITNYSDKELFDAVDLASEFRPDFVYFADTHGSLDLVRDSARFKEAALQLHSVGTTVGFHLHDHSGLAMSNYFLLEELGFSFCDASLQGLGKGAGNLKIETVVPGFELSHFLDFVLEYPRFFEREINPLFFLTGRYSATDHYADQAKAVGLSALKFEKFLRNLDTVSRDNFDTSLMEEHGR